MSEELFHRFDFLLNNKRLLKPVMFFYDQYTFLWQVNEVVVDIEIELSDMINEIFAIGATNIYTHKLWLVILFFKDWQEYFYLPQN